MVRDVQPVGNRTSPNNGLSPPGEWFSGTSHRDLKAALKCGLSGPNWIEEFPWVLLGIRTAPKEDLGSSTAELVYSYFLNFAILNFAKFDFGRFMNSPHIFPILNICGL